MFAEAGLAEPAADARILLEEATGLSRPALMLEADTTLGEAAATALAGFLARRLRREPVFRIIGRREFWGLELQVTPAVLDPRADTETVVSAALAAMRDRAGERLSVLDLGTGSGAILCALLHEWQDAIGLGLDRSAEACRVARANLAALGLATRAAIVEGDWAASLAGPFDVVVANPPYIETAVLGGLDPEVRDHDPLLALDGGADGLDAYRVIAGELPRLLAPGGCVVLEVGSTQAQAVAALLAERGLAVGSIVRDLGGHQRVVVAGAVTPA